MNIRNYMMIVKGFYIDRSLENKLNSFSESNSFIKMEKKLIKLVEDFKTAMTLYKNYEESDLKKEFTSDDISNIKEIFNLLDLNNN